LPDRGEAGKTTCLNIAGTNLLGATVTTDNPEVQVSQVQVSETSIELCVNVSSNSSLGATRMIVTTAGGMAEGTFAIDPRIVVIAQDTTIGPSDLSFENTVFIIDGALTVTIDGVHRFASLTLRNGALITHPLATATGISKLDLTVDGTLQVDATSKIDVTGRGFLGEGRPGNSLGGGMTTEFQIGSIARAGGSYGGLGGSLGRTAGPVYGDLTDPNEVGSGGGGVFPTPSIAGTGGGLVRVVAQTVNLDGTINANGDPSDSQDTGGGSGGGIRLDVGTLQGTGQINANGGSGTRGGGGGGGRVAIYYQTLVRFDPATQVAASGGGGTQGHPNGGAGTIYLQGPGREEGELLVDNNNVVAQSLSTPLGSTTLGDLRIRRGARARVDGLVNLTGAMEVSFGAEVGFVGGRVIADTVDLNNGSVLTHLPTTATAFFKVDLSANTLRIDATSRIEVTALGFLGEGRPGNPLGGGMTQGFQIGSTARAGGSYGGLGGSSSGTAGPVYGDPTDPNDVGSGGGGIFPTPAVAGTGGGLIRVVAQTFNFDGTIRADGGATGSNDAGGGSGGGIRLDVGTLQGTGQITANGGSATRGGGGGGGRVAVYYQSLVGFDLATQVAASGGTGAQGHPNGQNGTVFTQQILASLSPPEGGIPVMKASIEQDQPVRLASLGVVPLSPSATRNVPDSLSTNNHTRLPKPNSRIVRSDRKGASPGSRSNSTSTKNLSTPVHKFGNVLHYAAGRSNAGVVFIFFMRLSRSARANFHSKGLAMVS
jgi:hypothetical protein